MTAEAQNFVSVHRVWQPLFMKEVRFHENVSCQSAERALANYCERLVSVTPDLLRKSTPEGFVGRNCNVRTLL